MLLVLAGYWVYVYRRMKLDEEEEQMRIDTIQLREILQITKKDGYILSTENNVWLAGTKPYTLHPTSYTLHLTPYTLHPAPYF